jgi:hypothetical protein
MVLVIAGSFLPWLSIGSRTLGAWGIPALDLVPGAGTGGPPTGAVLLVVVLVLLPYVIRRPLPMVGRVLLAAVATNAAGSAIVLGLTGSSRVSLGVGLFVTLAGAILIVVGDAGTARQRASGGHVDA